MKHFISLLDYSQEELTEVVNRADYLAVSPKLPRKGMRRVKNY